MATDGGVLIVEDDATLAGLLVDHLRRRGVAARACGSLEAAVADLAAMPAPALIVLDINLPDAAGWDLTLHPAYHAAGSPPVIVASAVAVRPERLAASGVAGYLPKPFALPTFMAVVERYTGPAAAEQEAS